ncbi:septal ring lytic transglycosylase RlpA family protein [Advenella sp. RU8]|uniref:septal ring lytic transglycosylase RlpA family protein n=1 Tax=Advenella sp. RU8 TaxID=3399575 RepID=UPI003AAD50DD
MKNQKHQHLFLALCVTFSSYAAHASTTEKEHPKDVVEVQKSMQVDPGKDQKTNTFRITANGIFPESSYDTAFGENLRSLDTAEIDTSTEIEPEEITPASSTGFKAQPSYRSHARAYTIKGKRYVPFANNITDFSQVGTASWYGPGFHGKRTANGEKYNQNMMTAAHKELPLNSVVKVTRVSTGESITVRINDRGPFHDNRIIDLSYGAAKKLGIVNKGSAKVKVELIKNNAKGKKAGKTML